jgi:hypothetical protein
MGTTLTSAQFDVIYWASKPPAVQALQSMPLDFTDPAPSGRTDTAMSLATNGYQIDVPIMSWGWDPLLVMTQREQYGYTWVPSALMPPVQMAPGITEPGEIPYDPAHPPTGAILVSTDPADYSPYAAPPSPPPASTSLVGVNEGNGYYSAYPAALQQLTQGEQYSGDPRGTFTFHFAPSLFSPGNVTAWFTLNAG